MTDARTNIRKIVEWHFTCLETGLPTNFVPLIVGPSGSGKTHTIKESIRDYHEKFNKSRELEDKLEVALIEIDASTLTAEGWSGFNLSEAIYEKCPVGYEIESAIVFIDEIDKLAMRGELNRSEHLRGVQCNLLKWLDRNQTCYITDHKRRIEVSTAQMTFVFSGAFEDLFERKYREKSCMGFDAALKQTTDDIYSHKITWRDIKQYGLLPELTNRFNILLQTQNYSQKELKKIIDNSSDKAFIEEMLKVNISSTKAAKEAVEQRVGARGLMKYMYQEAIEKYELKL